MGNEVRREYRIAILDDEAMWRSAVVGLLERDPIISVVGVAATQKKAVDLAARYMPDVFLVDLMLNHSWQTGVSATIAILEASPLTKVIILTSCESNKSVIEATCAGAVDYLSKKNCEDLLPVILSHFRGGFSPRDIIAREVANLHQELIKHTLTEQEIQILENMSRNVLRSQLANTMNKSESTIKSQIGSILKKLNVSNLSDAIDKVNHGGIFFPMQKK